MKKVMIRYGEGPTAGNGHRVRMQRLCKALMQRGAVVDIKPANFVEILDSVKRHPVDVLVMDVPTNDNRELEAFRPHVAKLVVVVGIGHTVDTETSWMADIVVYQNGRDMPDLFFPVPAPGATMLSGVDYLMVDPRSASWRQPELGTSVLSYFGAGFPVGYAAIFASELGRLLPEVTHLASGDGAWQHDWARQAASARLVVASMGMAASEAAAVCTPVVTVSVDEEHAADADALSNLVPYLYHAGTLPTPEALAGIAAEQHGWSKPRYRFLDVPIDGLGVYRVARVLLE